MSGSLRALAIFVGVLFAVCMAVSAYWGALLTGVLLVGVLLVARHEADW